MPKKIIGPFLILLKFFIHFTLKLFIFFFCDFFNKSLFSYKKILVALLKVGIKYAAGGVPAMGKPEFGSLQNWSLALLVIVVTLGIKFYTRGITSVAAVLVGLVVGYIVAYFMGMVSFGNVGKAAAFALPNPLHFGVEFSTGAIIGICLMSIVSAIETVGDVSGITKGGAGREASTEEIQGATYADGLGTAISGVFGGLPNTSFSQTTLNTDSSSE